MVATSTVKENNMGQMKALVMDIEDMLSAGTDVESTAKYLGAPLELVEEIYENLNGPNGGGPDYDDLSYDAQHRDHHDGQPDEAQEWHDFDPDC